MTINITTPVACLDDVLYTVKHLHQEITSFKC